MKRLLIISAAMTGVLPSNAAFANGVGENIAWQFETSAEQAAQIYQEEVRQRRLNGFYSAPVYNTMIENQYNCAVNSTSTGNLSSTNAVANSPSSSGHSSDATGNQNDTTDASGNLASGGSNDTEQENEGRISSRARGDMSTSVRGDNFQALNTDQTNSGTQTSTVNGSTACQYAAAR